jgi:hypothetical protein
MPLAAILLLCAAALAAQTTNAEVDQWTRELSNWGRWGKDDQLGALNLITPAKRKAAARMVKEGFVVSLARETNYERAADNPQPYTHTMLATGESPRGEFAVDSFGVAFHGYQHTHLDALAHMFWQGKMYNGFSQKEGPRKAPGSWPSPRRGREYSPAASS